MNVEVPSETLWWLVLSVVVQIRRFLEPGILRDDFYWFCIFRRQCFSMFFVLVVIYIFRCYISFWQAQLVEQVRQQQLLTPAETPLRCHQSLPKSGEPPVHRGITSSLVLACGLNEFLTNLTGFRRMCIVNSLPWEDWIKKCRRDVMGRFKSLNLLRPSLKNQQQTRSELGWHFFYPPVPLETFSFFFSHRNIRSPWSVGVKAWVKAVKQD